MTDIYCDASRKGGLTVSGTLVIENNKFISLMCSEHRDSSSHGAELRALEQACKIIDKGTLSPPYTLYTDCISFKDTIERRNPLKFQTIWRRIFAYCDKYDITVKYIKGHSRVITPLSIVDFAVRVKCIYSNQGKQQR